jgi:hypothetical protein
MMNHSPEIKKLETQVAQDEQRYSEIERLKADLLQHIPTKDFSAVATELKYRGEMEALAHCIRIGEEMLAGWKTQSR